MGEDKNSKNGVKLKCNPAQMEQQASIFPSSSQTMMSLMTKGFHDCTQSEQKMSKTFKTLCQ